MQYCNAQYNRIMLSKLLRVWILCLTMLNVSLDANCTPQNCNINNIVPLIGTFLWFTKIIDRDRWNCCYRIHTSPILFLGQISAIAHSINFFYNYNYSYILYFHKSIDLINQNKDSYFYVETKLKKNPTWNWTESKFKYRI